MRRNEQNIAARKVKRMKRKTLISMMNVLIMLIGITMVMTGCPQTNNTGNKGTTPVPNNPNTPNNPTLPNNPSNPANPGGAPSFPATIPVKIETDYMPASLKNVKFNGAEFLGFGNDTKLDFNAPTGGDFIYLILSIDGKTFELRTRDKFKPVENGDWISGENRFQITENTLVVYGENGQSGTFASFVEAGILDIRNNTGFIKINSLVWNGDQIPIGDFTAGKAMKYFAHAGTYQLGITITNAGNGLTTGILTTDITSEKGKVTLVDITAESPASSGSFAGTLYGLYK